MEDTPRPAVRPASELDIWQRLGVYLRLSTDAFATDADGWLWAGPTDDKERAVFWSIVKASRCVVLEHLNPAVIGLVWYAGHPCVAYDLEESQRIITSLRAVSSERMEEYAQERDKDTLHAIQHTDMGPHSPVFRVGVRVG